MPDLIATTKNSVILGLGRTGWAVARFFSRSGQRFWVVDDHATAETQAAFANTFSDHTICKSQDFECDWAMVAEVVLSPGIARSHTLVQQALQHDVPVISDIDIFCRHAQAPIVAITGSNGKSTVTTLVGEMAKAAGKKVGVGGNIGVPALDVLAENVELYVLELSSFQLESTHELSAAVATILNITPDHMDRYATIQDYHRAKQRIYFRAKQVVTNREDALTEPPLADGVKRTSFGLNTPDFKQFGVSHESGKAFLVYGFNPLIEADELLMRGKHNQANALAALAIGHAMDLPMDTMLSVLKDFPGLPHRCETVCEHQGIVFINDSKATNVGATVAALKGLATDTANIVLIAGGDAKGADLSALKEWISRYVKAVTAFGKDASQFGDVCEEAVPFFLVDDLDAAFEQAVSEASPGDLVLLSPACSSLDMYPSFEARGQHFASLARALCH